ncbi:Hypothetical predicted protein [Olea europaea subsp. europaea]|uniref:Uncharacterized protein n=1 Tax=Olea europaea subsp. europaea TaxID=158383 RepID=A0A8S0VB98_OLEEU|nr:Hypothetical predicted protein [Olea europaea subsp. europaea]
MVEARNYDVIQTLLHIDDVPPVLIDPKSFDRRLVRGNDGDTDDESDEDNNGDLAYKISEHGTAESENVHRAEENNEALDDEIDDSEGTDIGHLLRTLDDHPTRGACKQIKISRIVRTTREKIRALCNSDGSKFPKVDTFEFAYSGKNKCWTCNAAKAQHDEMLVKEHEYLIEKANEQQLPEDIHLEEIPIDDPDAGINIMVFVLGTKPGHRTLRLGDGRLRDIGISSSNVHNLEKELEAERAA